MKLFSVLAALALFSTTEAIKIEGVPTQVTPGQLYIDKNYVYSNFKDILAKNRVVMFAEFGAAKSDGLKAFLINLGYDIFVVNVNQQQNQSSHKIEHWLEDELKTKKIDFPQVYVDGHKIGGDAEVRDKIHHGVLFAKH